MPQIENNEILGRMVRSIIGVISRRTSEAYALLIARNGRKPPHDQTKARFTLVNIL